MSHTTIKSGILGLILMFVPPALAGDDILPFTDYRSESWYLPQSPSVSAGPAASFFNPAAWAMSDQGALDFWWDDTRVRSDLDNYGLAFGRGLGFAMRQTTFGNDADNFRLYDYTLGFSKGTRAGTFGIGYRWAHGDTDRLARQKAVSAGFISRPSRHFTLGISGITSLESRTAQGLFDLGIRPLGKSWLTLFADWSVNHDEAFFGGGEWGAGIEVRPFRGLHLGGKLRERPGTDDLEYSAMVGVTLGFGQASAHAHYDHDDDLINSTFMVRMNPPFDGIADHELQLLGKKSYYYPISLENKFVTYQKYRMFDDTRVAWLDLLRLMDTLKENDRIQGVAINLAGTRFRSSLLWEMREEILELQAAGKEVIVHLDRSGFALFYLASAADRLTLDPYGQISMPGLALSRSYLKGTLEKLGVGLQAHRYFKYKSALETASRDHMSEADREQRQRIVDVLFEMFREEIAYRRDMTSEAFETIIDEKTFVLAQEALALGLVDAAARWDQLGPWLIENRGTGLAPAGTVERPSARTDEPWGPLPKIPVVYALGECAMDSGINGRATSAYLRGLVNDPEVAAVILRADSPGGDPLPCDLVNEALRQLKEAGKPVIVSQGDVAASGGYMISLEGTEILTTPLTITGSIGVISGWVYEDGLGEKTGVTSDVVSRGRHADLFAKVNIPVIGSVPRRAKTEEELARTEFVIREMYDTFVTDVAQGRGLEKDAVEKVAQGRVWMGGDAIERDLCDRFGGLADAIDLARREAGIEDKRYQLVEYPPRKLFQMPNLMPSLPSFLGVGTRINNMLVGLIPEPADAAKPEMVLPLGLDASSFHFLKTINEAAGQPVLMMSPDLLPDGWRDDP